MGKKCTFKACESSKDFVIAVETLIKPLGYQQKINGCFASTFKEAVLEPSQTSNIVHFAETYNCFKQRCQNFLALSR